MRSIIVRTERYKENAASSKYPKRRIGDDEVSAQGLGYMGMSSHYISKSGFCDEESLRVLTKAADLGLIVWDTGDVYELHVNERLIGC